MSEDRLGPKLGAGGLLLHLIPRAHRLAGEPWISCGNVYCWDLERSGQNGFPRRCPISSLGPG